MNRFKNKEIVLKFIVGDHKLKTTILFTTIPIIRSLLVV